MTTRAIRRFLGPLVGLVMALAGVLALAGPASAATVTGGTLSVTHLSNGALRLTYNGHSYTCYKGDLCVYRGGSFGAYYKCQTVGNSTTSNGWSVNNQYNPGGTAVFHAKSGYSSSSQPIGTATVVYWSRVASFTTCG